MQLDISVKVNGQLVQTHVKEVSGTLEQMEETIHALSKQVAGQTLQASINAVASPRPLFSKDGGELRHRGYQSRTVIGLNGPITIRRARFQCGKTGAISIPLDDLLELPAGEVSVSLARRALRLGCCMSFEELQKELYEQHAVRLTDSTLDSLMQRVGGVAVADRKKNLEALEAATRGVARVGMVQNQGIIQTPQRLYISCDGITYRTRYREVDSQNPKEKRVVYQEMKVGCVFWQDSMGNWHKQVVVGRDDPQRFGLDLWQIAVRCGMLQAQEVIFISDGGGWCNSVAELYFKDATRILDWYHLSEHVWSAGRQLYPQKEEAAKGWVDRCMDKLHDFSGIGLLLHLERCLKSRGQGAEEALQPLLDYLRPRLEITDYVDYRSAGYVIGSGMMESSCKQVVGRRLKGPGMQWSEEGALAMTALVAQRLNETWDSFWESRPLRRAA